MKKGALHRQLGIPLNQKIPIGLLNRILSAGVGRSIVFNGRKIKITKKLLARARLAKTLKSIKR